MRPLLSHTSPIMASEVTFRVPIIFHHTLTLNLARPPLLMMQPRISDKCWQLPQTRNPLTRRPASTCDCNQNQLTPNSAILRLHIAFVPVSTNHSQGILATQSSLTGTYLFLSWVMDAESMWYVCNGCCCILPLIAPLGDLLQDLRSSDLRACLG